MNLAASEITSERIHVSDDLEEAFEEMYERGWTDGLPVVPPTPDRVRRLIEGAGLRGDELIAELAPRGGLATVEKIAVNAVMAGCKPEYLPVVIAAVEALAQPQLNLLGVQTTTNPVAPFILVNGPVRRTIDLNCGRGALGPGWRANATIGRAVRLVMINIGGAVPAQIDKAVHGSPAKYSFCVGELEEESPWEPFHVDHGFSREDSTVTVIPAQGTQSVAASYLDVEKSILPMLANGLAVWGTNSYNKSEGNPAVIMAPRHAHLFADAGWSKARIQEWLYENTKVPGKTLPVEPKLMAHHRLFDGDRVCICKQPSDIAIVVAGGVEAYHITLLASYGNPMAIARIRTTAR